VIFVDQPPEGFVAVGRLPVPKAKPPAPRSAPSGPATLVHISIPTPIHVQKPPFDMLAKGELDVRLTPGAPTPSVGGELTVVEGAMELGGRIHALSKRTGAASVRRRAPRRRARSLPRACARRSSCATSRASAATTQPADGADFQPVSGDRRRQRRLWDILPVHNAGRVKHVSGPDLPPSSAPDLPREYDVVLISYMALNLPHNLFLDRINAWSDPYDDRFSYGKVRHLQAESVSKSGSTRVRVLSRPPSTGRSEAELEAGWLWVNQPRTQLGVGVVGGSRAGGGCNLLRLVERRPISRALDKAST
jgi:hypothetical protein